VCFGTEGGERGWGGGRGGVVGVWGGGGGGGGFVLWVLDGGVCGWVGGGCWGGFGAKFPRLTLVQKWIIHVLYERWSVRIRGIMKFRDQRFKTGQIPKILGLAKKIAKEKKAEKNPLFAELPR